MKKSISLSELRSNLNKFCSPKNLKSLLLFEKRYGITPRNKRKFSTTLRVQYIHMIFDAANSHHDWALLQDYVSPSLETIARLAGCCKLSVIRANKKLEALNCIMKLVRKGTELVRYGLKRFQKNLTNVYRVCMEFLDWLDSEFKFKTGATV